MIPIPLERLSWSRKQELQRSLMEAKTELARLKAMVDKLRCLRLLLHEVVETSGA